MRYGISLFCSGGIGDLAFRENNVKIILANELLPDRADVFKQNYPDTKLIVGDIRNKYHEIIKTAKQILGNKELDVIFATPPCQGMSKNGRGKLLSEKRLGRREYFDERNQLIIPTIEIIKSLSPEFIFFENVPEMQHTEIIVNNRKINILQFISESLPDYIGTWEVIEFADYGVPQRRQRLLTIFTKNKIISNLITKKYSIFPPRTHSSAGIKGTLPWVTLRDVIGNLPPLDAKEKETAYSQDIPFHRVPTLDKEKYFWIENTPEGKSAFDNQCAFCHFSENQTHGSQKQDGINRARTDTPLYCQKCGRRLPRPCVKDGDTYRIMRGYTSAYKRMLWDQPSPALTRNMSYACSDNKIHPSQNRVLSLYEAFIIHTINKYNYIWKRGDGKISDKTIREIIGESIPPKGLEIIISHIFKIADSHSFPFKKMEQLRLL